MKTIKDRDTVFQIDTDAFLDRRADCEEILLLSKTTLPKNGNVWIGAQDQAHCPCQCNSRNLRRVIDVYKLRYKFVWFWPGDNIEDCDEVAGSDLLKGCYVKGYGSMHLRRHRCDKEDILVGCELAEFIIYKRAGSGYLPVFQGELRGTVGLAPHADGKARCCAPNHNEGSILAKGVGEMEECTFCATYQGTFGKLDPDTVCEGVKTSWHGHIDGVVCCPCDEHYKKKEEKC